MKKLITEKSWILSASLASTTANYRPYKTSPIEMPRTSQRKRVLKQLEQIIKRRRVEKRYRSLLFDDSENEGEVVGDDGSLQMVMDVALQAAYDSISSQRDLYDRKPYGKGNSKFIFERDLKEDDAADGTPPLAHRRRVFTKIPDAS
jgi:hypothetical protein